MVYFPGEVEKDMLSFYLQLLEDEGDRALFIRLYEENMDRLLRIARWIVKTEDLAEEAVHESFISVAINFYKISGKTCQEQKAYIVKTVKNKSIDILRRERKYRNMEELSEELLIPFDNIRAERELQELKEEVRLAIRYIQELPPIYQCVLESRLLEGKSNKEAARDLGISEDLCAKRYRRGCDKVAERLRKEEITL